MYHIFGLSTLAAAGNRTPKAELLLKHAKWTILYEMFADFSVFH